jgi:exodeoxyribonuclease I
VGFVFYDTETTGTDEAYDQILQFAAIHTDFDFNEVDRFEIRCQLLPHVVPAPGAMRVTKLNASQLFDPSLATHYTMACELRKKLQQWSPALFIGYNSLRFDERMLRHAFYKTLHDPYLTNSDRNSRSDAMRIVQASSLFEPDALAIPVDETGAQVFKLDQVAPLNGFSHERAHDAMADAEATLHLCKILAEKAPKVWSLFMRFSQKAAVADHLAAERIFCLSDFYFGKPYAYIVTCIGRHEQNTSEHYVYDLAVDPDSLSPLDEGRLRNRVKRSPKPVRRLKSNGAPVIVAQEDAPLIAKATVLGVDELARRAEIIHSDPDFCERLIAAFQASDEPEEPSEYIESQIYSGFYTNDDKVLMERFHLVPWEQRAAILPQFRDERLRELGLRLIHIERPDLLPAEERVRRDRAWAIRLTSDPTNLPWLTFAEAIEEIDGIIATAESSEHAFLHEHRTHLSDRLVKAMAIIAG